VKRYFEQKLYTFLIVLICFSFNAVQASAKEEKQENKLTPQNPRYEFKFSLNEFSIFHSAIVGGLKKYGGGAEFNLRMAKQGDEIVWAVTISNPRIIESLNYYIADKSADLITAINADSLDSKSRIELKAAKSLIGKVNYGQNNPVWDLVQISGLVVEDTGVLFIEGEQGKYKITGDQLTELGKTKGKPIVVNGVVKVEDQIELVSFLEKKENTLELFVMSLCPFAKIAESSLLDFLESYPHDPKPSLEIHYIFYKKKEGEKITFTAMHGEEEIRENLVQMVIRNEYPQFYHNYLLKRINESDTPWDRLAKKMGMEDEAVKLIERAIEKERGTLIQKEYGYVTGTYGIYDGSPSYVWESQRIADIREVEAFEGLKFSPDKCSDEKE
jgi:hypothetical protein